MWSFIKSAFKFLGLVGRFLSESVFLLERGAKQFEQCGKELNNEMSLMAEKQRMEQKERLEKRLGEDAKN